MADSNFWTRMRKARLVRVVLIYAGASWVTLEATGFFIENFGLPEWFLPAALVLLVIGLVVVTTTAWIQSPAASAATGSGTERETADAAGSIPGVGAVSPDRASAGSGLRRLLTWRNAVMGGVLAFALWGVAAAGWLLLTDGTHGAAAGSAAGPDSGAKKLVVLPFENLSGQGDDYFAAGITDAITARLARLSGLGVISRQSAVQYSGSDKTVQEIGGELGVGYILEGTVQRERPNDPASRVRVIPQLIRVADDTHLWAATYDEEMQEVFQVQSDIAERVARALDVTLLEPDRQAIESRPSDNLQAYDYFLRGNDYLQRSGLGYLDRPPVTAVELYERAVELDPEFALAWAALARAHIQIFDDAFDVSPERLEAGRDAAERALALEPDLAEGHLAMGEYHVMRGDLDRAMEQFERARASRPPDAELLRSIADVQRRRGAADAALANLERAVELDPRSVTTALDHAAALEQAGRYAEAERQIDRAIAMAPDQIVPYRAKIDHYAYRLEDLEGAREAVALGSSRMGRLSFAANLLSSFYGVFRVLEPELGASLRELSIGSFGYDTVSHYSYHLARGWQERTSGRAEAARAQYDSALALLEPWAELAPDAENVLRALAEAYAGLGRRAEAVAAARRALEVKPPSNDAVDGYQNLLHLARIHAMLGERDPAIARLAELLDGDPDYPVGLTIDPVWDPLRDDPRFQELVGRAG